MRWMREQQADHTNQIRRGKQDQTSLVTEAQGEALGGPEEVAKFRGNNQSAEMAVLVGELGAGCCWIGRDAKPRRVLGWRTVSQAKAAGDRPA